MKLNSCTMSLLQSESPTTFQQRLKSISVQYGHLKTKVPTYSKAAVQRSYKGHVIADWVQTLAHPEDGSCDMRFSGVRPRGTWREQSKLIVHCSDQRAGSWIREQVLEVKSRVWAEGHSGGHSDTWPLLVAWFPIPWTQRPPELFLTDFRTYSKINLSCQISKKTISQAKPERKH